MTISVWLVYQRQEAGLTRLNEQKGKAEKGGNEPLPAAPHLDLGGAEGLDDNGGL
jgi:hypothetical protein